MVLGDILNVSLKFVPNGLVDNQSAMIQVMVSCLIGDKTIT